MTLLKTKGRSDLYVQSNVWTQGSGFVDEGGGQVRVLRNEGTVDARTIAVQLVPASAARRIDAPAPPTNCQF